MQVDPLAIKKILIIQFRPFGDVLLATSYLAALKEKIPHAKIDFLVKQPFQEILYNNPFINEVIIIGHQKGLSYLLARFNLFFSINKKKYDLIIDQQKGAGSGQVVLFSGAQYKLGWADSKWQAGYNLKAVRGPVRYRASQNFDMLKPLGVKERSFELFYHVNFSSKDYINTWLNTQDLGKQKFICISPGSPRTRKKWGIQYYAELINLLIQKTSDQKTSEKIVILWAPSEFEDAKALMGSGKEKELVLAPPTTFNQAAALLKKSKLLICNDGGLNHLAVALKTPSLAIFGNTSSNVWSPEGLIPGHYHISNPDWQRMTDNSFGVRPDRVFDKIKNILEP